MVKKENVHLKLTEELSEIDSELEDAMEALSETNQRIDAYLNDDAEPDADTGSAPAAEPADRRTAAANEPHRDCIASTTYQPPSSISASPEPCPASLIATSFGSTSLLKLKLSVAPMSFPPLSFPVIETSS